MVDEAQDHLADVVPLLLRRRDDVGELGVGLHDVVGIDDRRVLGVVLGQEREQLLGDQDRLLVVVGDEVRDAGQRHVGVRPTQVVGGHLLPRHLGDHARAGDEHVRLARLDDEVGERRGVRRPPAQGPAMIEICGTTPESRTLL